MFTKALKRVRSQWLQLINSRTSHKRSLVHSVASPNARCSASQSSSYLTRCHALRYLTLRWTRACTELKLWLLPKPARLVFSFSPQTWLLARSMLSFKNWSFSSRPGKTRPHSSSKHYTVVYISAIGQPIKTPQNWSHSSMACSI